MLFSTSNPVICWMLDRIFPHQPRKNLQYEDFETVWSEYHENSSQKVLFYDECIHYYRLILQSVCDIGVQVYEPYIDHPKHFITPSEDLNKIYVNLIDALRKIHRRKDFEKIPILEMFEYADLIINHESKIRGWLHFKDILFKHRSIIEYEYQLRCIGDFETHPQIQEILKEASSELSKLKASQQKQKAIHDDESSDFVPLPSTYELDIEGHRYITGNKSLHFQSSKSDRFKLFSLLVKANGNWVKIRDLSRVMKRDDQIIRIMLNKLQKSIDKQKLSDILRIDASGVGSYKLTSLVPITG